MQQTIDTIFALSGDIRYIAIYTNDQLTTTARPGLVGASEAESDRYEELIVNPTLLTLVRQRGNIDCGGVEFVLIRYGNFYQLIAPLPDGHASVAIELRADPLVLVGAIQAALGERET